MATCSISQIAGVVKFSADIKKDAEVIASENSLRKEIKTYTKNNVPEGTNTDFLAILMYSNLVVNGGTRTFSKAESVPAIQALLDKARADGNVNEDSVTKLKDLGIKNESDIVKIMGKNVNKVEYTQTGSIQDILFEEAISKQSITNNTYSFKAITSSHGNSTNKSMSEKRDIRISETRNLKAASPDIWRAFLDVYFPNQPELSAKFTDRVQDTFFDALLEFEHGKGFVVDVNDSINKIKEDLIDSTLNASEDFQYTLDKLFDDVLSSEGKTSRYFDDVLIAEFDFIVSNVIKIVRKSTKLTVAANTEIKGLDGAILLDLSSLEESDVNEMFTLQNTGVAVFKGDQIMLESPKTVFEFENDPNKTKNSFYYLQNSDRYYFVDQNGNYTDISPEIVYNFNTENNRNQDSINKEINPLDQSTTFVNNFITLMKAVVFSENEAGEKVYSYGTRMTKSDMIAVGMHLLNKVDGSIESMKEALEDLSKDTTREGSVARSLLLHIFETSDNTLISGKNIIPLRSIAGKSQSFTVVMENEDIVKAMFAALANKDYVRYLTQEEGRVSATPALSSTNESFIINEGFSGYLTDGKFTKFSIRDMLEVTNNNNEYDIVISLGARGSVKLTDSWIYSQTKDVAEKLGMIRAFEDIELALKRSGYTKASHPALLSGIFKGIVEVAAMNIEQKGFLEKYPLPASKRLGNHKSYAIMEPSVVLYPYEAVLAVAFKKDITKNPTVAGAKVNAISQPSRESFLPRSIDKYKQRFSRSKNSMSANPIINTTEDTGIPKANYKGKLIKASITVEGKSVKLSDWALSSRVEYSMINGYLHTDNRGNVGNIFYTQPVNYSDKGSPHMHILSIKNDYFLTPGEANRDKLVSNFVTYQRLKNIQQQDISVDFLGKFIGGNMEYLRELITSRGDIGEMTSEEQSRIMTAFQEVKEVPNFYDGGFYTYSKGDFMKADGTTYKKVPQKVREDFYINVLSKSDPESVGVDKEGFDSSEEESNLLVNRVRGLTLTRADIKRFADDVDLPKSFSARYVRKGKPVLDVTAAELSEVMGVEVSPEDIIEAMHGSLSYRTFEEDFSSTFGFKPTKETFEKAMQVVVTEQSLREEQLAKEKDGYVSVHDRLSALAALRDLIQYNKFETINKAKEINILLEEIGLKKDDILTKNSELDFGADYVMIGGRVAMKPTLGLRAEVYSQDNAYETAEMLIENHRKEIEKVGIDRAKVEGALKSSGVDLSVDEFVERHFLIESIYGHALKTLLMGDESYFNTRFSQKESISQFYRREESKPAHSRGLAESRGSLEAQFKRAQSSLSMGLVQMHRETFEGKRRKYSTENIISYAEPRIGEADTAANPSFVFEGLEGKSLRELESLGILVAFPETDNTLVIRSETGDPMVLINKGNNTQTFSLSSSELHSNMDLAIARLIGKAINTSTEGIANISSPNIKVRRDLEHLTEVHLVEALASMQDNNMVTMPDYVPSITMTDPMSFVSILNSFNNAQENSDAIQLIHPLLYRMYNRARGGRFSAFAEEGNPALKWLTTTVEYDRARQVLQKKAVFNVFTFEQMEKVGGAELYNSFNTMNTSMSFVTTQMELPTMKEGVADYSDMKSKKISNLAELFDALGGFNRSEDALWEDVMEVLTGYPENLHRFIGTLTVPSNQKTGHKKFNSYSDVFSTEGGKSPVIDYMANEFNFEILTKAHNWDTTPGADHKASLTLVSQLISAIAFGGQTDVTNRSLQDSIHALSSLHRLSMGREFSKIASALAVDDVTGEYAKIAASLMEGEFLPEKGGRDVEKFNSVIREGVYTLLEKSMNEEMDSALLKKVIEDSGYSLDIAGARKKVLITIRSAFFKNSMRLKIPGYQAPVSPTHNVIKIFTNSGGGRSGRLGYIQHEFDNNTSNIKQYTENNRGEFDKVLPFDNIRVNGKIIKKYALQNTNLSKNLVEFVLTPDVNYKTTFDTVEEFEAMDETALIKYKGRSYYKWYILEMMEETRGGTPLDIYLTEELGKLEEDVAEKWSLAWYKYKSKDGTFIESTEAFKNYFRITAKNLGNKATISKATTLLTLETKRKDSNGELFWETILPEVVLPSIGQSAFNLEKGESLTKVIGTDPALYEESAKKYFSKKGSALYKYVNLEIDSRHFIGKLINSYNKLLIDGRAMGFEQEVITYLEQRQEEIKNENSINITRKVSLVLTPADIKKVNGIINSYSETYTKKVAGSFIAALDTILTRVPGQSKQSGFIGRIVEFLDSQNNSAHAATAHMVTTGGDMDVDTLSVLVRDIDESGISHTVSKFTNSEGVFSVTQAITQYKRDIINDQQALIKNVEAQNRRIEDYIKFLKGKTVANDDIVAIEKNNELIIVAENKIITEEKLQKGKEKIERTIFNKYEHMFNNSMFKGIFQGLTGANIGVEMATPVSTAELQNLAKTVSNLPTSSGFENIKHDNFNINGESFLSTYLYEELNAQGKESIGIFAILLKLNGVIQSSKYHADNEYNMTIKDGKGEEIDVDPFTFKFSAEFYNKTTEEDVVEDRYSFADIDRYPISREIERNPKLQEMLLDVLNDAEYTRTEDGKEAIWENFRVLLSDQIKYTAGKLFPESDLEALPAVEVNKMAAAYIKSLFGVDVFSVLYGTNTYGKRGDALANENFKEGNILFSERVIRHKRKGKTFKKGSIKEVLTPKGEKSKLWEDIKKIPSHDLVRLTNNPFDRGMVRSLSKNENVDLGEDGMDQRRLALYSKLYTRQFTDRIGDWTIFNDSTANVDENGEPVLVIKEIDGDKVYFFEAGTETISASYVKLGLFGNGKVQEGVLTSEGFNAYLAFQDIISSNPEVLGEAYTNIIGMQLSNDTQSQLLSAATDNAKELILGKIRSNTTTNSIISAMLMLGFSLDTTVSFLYDPEIEKVLMYYNTQKKEFKSAPMNIEAIHDIPGVDPTSKSIVTLEKVLALVEKIKVYRSIRNLSENFNPESFASDALMDGVQGEVLYEAIRRDEAERNEGKVGNLVEGMSYLNDQLLLNTKEVDKDTGLVRRRSELFNAETFILLHPHSRAIFKTIYENEKIIIPAITRTAKAVTDFLTDKERNLDNYRAVNEFISRAQAASYLGAKKISGDAVIGGKITKVDLSSVKGRKAFIEGFEKYLKYMEYDMGLKTPVFNYLGFTSSYRSTMPLVGFPMLKSTSVSEIEKGVVKSSIESLKVDREGKVNHYKALYDNLAKYALITSAGMFKKGSMADEFSEINLDMAEYLTTLPNSFYSTLLNSKNKTLKDLLLDKLPTLSILEKREAKNNGGFGLEFGTEAYDNSDFVQDNSFGQEQLTDGQGEYDSMGDIALTEFESAIETLRTVEKEEEVAINQPYVSDTNENIIFLNLEKNKAGLPYRIFETGSDEILPISLMQSSPTGDTTVDELTSAMLLKGMQVGYDTPYGGKKAKIIAYKSTQFQEGTNVEYDTYMVSVGTELIEISGPVLMSQNPSLVLVGNLIASNKTASGKMSNFIYSEYRDYDYSKDAGVNTIGNTKITKGAEGDFINENASLLFSNNLVKAEATVYKGAARAIVPMDNTRSMEDQHLVYNREGKQGTARDRLILVPGHYKGNTIKTEDFFAATEKYMLEVFNDLAPGTASTFYASSLNNEEYKGGIEIIREVLQGVDLKFFKVISKEFNEEGMLEITITKKENINIIKGDNGDNISVFYNNANAFVSTKGKISITEKVAAIHQGFYKVPYIESRVEGDSYLSMFKDSKDVSKGIGAMFKINAKKGEQTTYTRIVKGDEFNSVEKAINSKSDSKKNENKIC